MFLDDISESIRKTDVAMMNGLSLAFVGDSVYDLMIRTFILSQGDSKAEMLHKRSVKYANASFQAKAMDSILPVLNEKEEAVFRRGRNAHSAHTPKNKSEGEYHRATGFEALFGYLYLMGETKRLRELFEIALNSDKEDETHEEKKEIGKEPYNVLAKRG